MQVQGRGRPKREGDGVRELGAGRLSLQDPHVAHLCLMSGLSHLSRHPPPTAPTQSPFLTLSEHRQRRP